MKIKLKIIRDTVIGLVVVVAGTMALCYVVVAVSAGLLALANIIGG